jgi:hypothetical protein
MASNKEVWIKKAVQVRTALIQNLMPHTGNPRVKEYVLVMTKLSVSVFRILLEPYL